MATLQYVVRATDDASAAFARIAKSAESLNEDLNKLDGKTATPKLKLEDKQAKFDLDDVELKLARLDKRVTTTKMNDDQIARARHEADRLSLALDKLNAKRTKIHVDSSALNKLGRAAPGFSALGTAAALSPALIPLAGAIAGAVGAITISFGAAGIAAGGFGLVAKSVLTNAGQDATKLATLQAQLAKDTTAKQKAATQQQITALETGWSGAYKSLVTSYQQFTARWEKLSASIATPALASWFGALNKMLQFLRPALQPVADLFDHWGKAISRYFSDPINNIRIKNMVAAFGDFAAIQLGQVVKFVTDLVKGIANLGKDFAANGGTFGAAGTWLLNIGAGFLTWSKSAKARADVQGFMHFVHQEGPVITGILKDLGKLLPGIFAGATTVGTLELQALGNFLNLVAKLPPNWQKGLTEAAGALLLMSKLGVLKVGIKLVGLGAKLLSGGTIALSGDTAAVAMRAAIVSGGAEAAAEIRAAMTGGAASGGGAAAAAEGGGIGAIASKARGLLVGIIADIGIPVILARIFHLPGQSLSIWDSDVKGLRDSLHKTADSFKADWHIMASSFDAFRHDAAATGHGIANTWDTLRHDAATTGHNIANTWDTLRHDAATTGHVIANAFDVLRHTLASTWGTIRTNAVNAWNTIWNNVSARVQTGIATVLRLVGGIRNGIISRFSAAGTWLVAAGRNVIQGLLNGLTAIWNKVKAFIGSIAGWIKAHKGPIALDAHLLEPAGRALMQGLHVGLLGGAKGPLGFIAGLTGTIGSLLSGGVGAIKGLFGGGHAGPGGGAPSANAALARRLMPAWGSGAEWAAWNAVAMRESGWSNIARNASSGAYGIAQALPPTKYPFAGQAAGGSNPTAQITWMIGYIRSRYGDPIGALAHENAFGWYDRGGWLRPGVTMAVNTTGQPEAVVGGAPLARVEALLAQLIAVTQGSAGRSGAAFARELNGTATRAVR